MIKSGRLIPAGFFLLFKEFLCCTAFSIDRFCNFQSENFGNERINIDVPELPDFFSFFESWTGSSESRPHLRNFKWIVTVFAWRLACVRFKKDFWSVGNE